MFEDSLLESGGRLKKRNPWATALSFAVEIAGVGLLVLLPLIYTEALPVRVMWQTSELFAPPTRHVDPPPEPQPVNGARQPSASNFDGDVLVLPNRIPPHPITIVDAGPPSTIGDGVHQDVPWSIPGTGNGKSGTLIAEVTKLATAHPTLKQVTRTTVSKGVSEGLLIRRVTPEYPQIAKATRTQGEVVLAAVISRDGMIQNLQVLSGHPLLAKAALDAVRQWRYRPYLLNGEPVEVETTVTVKFTLNQ